MNGFDVLEKIGDGPWVISGTLSTTGLNAANQPKTLTAVVAAGTLILTGDTPGPFNGTMTVNRGAVLRHLWRLWQLCSALVGIDGYPTDPNHPFNRVH